MTNQQASVEGSSGATLFGSRMDVGGVAFAVSNLHHAVQWILDRAARHKGGLSVRLANSYCIALAGSDERYRRLLNDDGVNFPDGAPVAAVMRFMFKPEGCKGADIGRVRGPSFFELALDKSREQGITHFFLGATPETLKKLEHAVKDRYPGIQLAGAYAPPFAPISNELVSDCVTKINDADPDIVWVGIGTPKQDFLTTALAEATGKVCAGVGAAFDFSSNSIREAPKWIQDSGFEWLYRLATEPRRLWKRYLVGNFQFIYLVVKNQGPIFLRAFIRPLSKRRPHQ